jgi:hypothetical protein
MGDNLLFSASLLTPLPSLPAGFNVRPLSIDDFSKGTNYNINILKINQYKYK